MHLKAIDPQIKEQVPPSLEIPEKTELQSSDNKLQNGNLSLLRANDHENKPNDPLPNIQNPQLNPSQVTTVGVPVLKSMPDSNGVQVAMNVDALELKNIFEALQMKKIQTKEEMDSKAKVALLKLANAPKPKDEDALRVWTQLQKNKNNPISLEKDIEILCDNFWNRRGLGAKGQFDALNQELLLSPMSHVKAFGTKPEKTRAREVASVKTEEDPDTSLKLWWIIALGVSLVLGSHFLSALSRRRKRKKAQSAVVVKAELLEPKRNLPTKVKGNF